MVLASLLATVLFPQTALPTEAQLRQTNSEILAFATEAARHSAERVLPADWPKEMDQSETYWLGEQPLTSWPSELRRFVLDRMVDRTKTEPAVRSWLLAADSMENSHLDLSLTFQLTLKTTAINYSRAARLVGRDSYQSDNSDLAKLLVSLSGPQRDEIERNHMEMPWKHLTGRQQALVGRLGWATITPPPAEEPTLVFDFYYQAAIILGKQRFDQLLARSTDPIRTR